MTSAKGSALTAARRLAMAAALLAMFFGPGNREAPAAQRLPELDVLIAVDRTTSMSALDDATGSRITAARRDLVALGENLDNAHFTVITFGRSASVRLPSTSDRAAYDAAVRSVQVEHPDAGSGTSIGRPVPLLLKELRRKAQPQTDRIPVIVFLSDGENTSPEPKASFTELGAAVQAGLVLGYGTEDGGVMPRERVDVEEPPPAADQVAEAVTVGDTGEPARSRLDEENLQQIAEELGAAYVHSDGGPDMARVAAALETAAYADIGPSEPERELRWLWALLLAVLVLPELRAGWRRYLEARREARA